MTLSTSYYLRIDIDDTTDEGLQDNSQPVETCDVAIELTFVDLHTRLRTHHRPGVSQIETLTSAVQDHLHLCSRTDLVVFRWPWIVGPEDEPHVDQISSWIERLTGDDDGEPVLGPAIRVGVIQHQVAKPPVLRWGRWTPAEPELDGLVRCSRAVETEALLRRRNAIWEPQDYHYLLPSGEHTDVFIRVADAIYEPQDAYVMACWLSERLTNGTGVVVDTGGLTPLLIQLESFLTRFGLEIGPTAILNAYPTGRPVVRRTVENALSELSDRILGILSVSSSGSLKRTLADELDRLATSFGIEYTIDIIVDRTAPSTESTPSASASDKLVSWLSIERPAQSGSSASCELCRSPEKAQLVAVDPRTYGAMALPDPHLVMLDTRYAAAGHLFWERVSAVRGAAIEVNSHKGSRVARGKRAALPVRPIFELIAQPDGLSDLVAERCRNILKDRSEKQDLASIFAATALVVTAPNDVKTVPIPAFAGDGHVDLGESVRHVLGGVGLNMNLPVVTMDDAATLNRHIADLQPSDSILIFSWGSVTGLTLRRLKLAVADALASQTRDRTVNAMIFHARPSTPSEWRAQENQFRPGVLECLWTSCFPWYSPIADESRLLDRSDIEESLTSDAAKRFLESRLKFLGMYATYSQAEDDWSPRFDLPDSEPRPEHIFWGMSRNNTHQQRVRGRSLYGRDLDCLTAYAAIGSVVNYTRLNEQPTAAPRWVMFDIGRIVRSYFDAIIICSVIRWLQPGELRWAERNEPESVRESVSFLFDQAADRDEQVLLVPELLLASAQGKVPELAHDIVRDKAEAIRDIWPPDDRFDMARGAVEVGLRLLANS